VRPRIAYQPGSSVLHRLHPLVKAGWLLLATAWLFVQRSPWAVLALFGLALLAFPLCGLNWKGMRGKRLLFTTAALLGALQLVFVHEGPVLVSLGPVEITRGGVESAVYVAGRFAAVVLLSYLFVLTTDPNQLAYALMQAGLPYRYGFALVTALRLVPVFEAEGQIVYNAQLARGVEYDVRSPRRVVALARQFFLPLLVSALGKVDALAVSMEGRCFGKHPTRTFLREVHLERRDAWALVALVLAVAAWLIAGWAF
jgi:energy-coupling factor transport system permease protein